MILRKTFRFEASHVLPKHPGKCSRLHGHSWVLHVSVSGPIDSETGFVMDYADISERVRPIIDCLDHYHLNDIMPYPSSEHVVLYIAQRLDQYNFPWHMLALEETCTSYCELTRTEYLATRD